MAGGAASEESEPLFVLEPLPELSKIIESFTEVSPVLPVIGVAAIIYFLVKFTDPMVKAWTTSLVILGLNYFITESLFYAMIFTCIYVLGFFLLLAAMNWDDLKSALGMDKARILSIGSFIIATWILVVLGTAIGMPAGPGIVVCVSVNAYLWWTYYSLEPTTA
tara:strand:+ start:479 stop:970 length:492 start_codon:yes stop_codon:yes gene_type:complete